jgi:hypothetical protein
VTLPEQFDQYDSFVEQIELLKFEKERLRKKLDRLYQELENIPNAVRQYGYVDICYDKNKKITLIEKPTDKTEVSE